MFGSDKAVYADTSKKQLMCTLEREEAYILMNELEHKGYDYICSELKGTMLTVTWPASKEFGKQLQ